MLRNNRLRLIPLQQNQTSFFGGSMAQRRKKRNLLFIALLSGTPFFLTACAMQGDQAKPQVSAQGQESGAAMILGAKKETPPPPPAGAPPRSQHTTPASYYEPVGPFFFYVETLTANTIPNKYGFAPTVACIQSGVFKRGMKMVVRFEVLDIKTGKRVTDKDGATMKLVLPHGEEVP